MKEKKDSICNYAGEVNFQTGDIAWFSKSKFIFNFLFLTMGK